MNMEHRTKRITRCLLLIIIGVGIGIFCSCCGMRDDLETDAGQNINVSGDADAEGQQSHETAVGKEITDNKTTDKEITAADHGGEILDTSGPVTDASVGLPLLEQLYSYEEQSYYGHKYLVVTGIAEEYEENFWQHIARIGKRSGESRHMMLPADVNGRPVFGVGERAFADREIEGVSFPDTLLVIEEGAFQNTGISSLELPESLMVVEAGAFENCSLQRIMLPGQPMLIGERAFAGNKELWTALVPNVETVLEEGVFEDCDQDFLLCYGDDLKGKENLVARYARENGFDSMEIVLSQKPIVNYHEEPLVLKPEVRSFFYGEDGDEEKEQWCTWECDENAPNFGYDDWQWPGCSSWCGVMDFEQEAKATSELASGNGRYSAANVLGQNRLGAWAEGVEGPGIGESITYRQSCTCLVSNKWEALTKSNKDPVRDGFMRYCEICIVNGYAKNQKTWEENGRVKKFLMYVEEKPYAFLELEDTILPQYFMLPEDDIKIIDGGMLEVRFEIVDVYPGSLYEDTCLTGLVMEFTGRYAH